MIFTASAGVGIMDIHKALRLKQKKGGFYWERFTVGELCYEDLCGNFHGYWKYSVLKKGNV